MKTRLGAPAVGTNVPRRLSGLTCTAFPRSIRAGAYRRGILLHILNPKLPLFVVAFLPQFMPADAGTEKLVELESGFTAVTFVTFVGYAALAATGGGGCWRARGRTGMNAAAATGLGPGFHPADGGAFAWPRHRLDSLA